MNPRPFLPLCVTLLTVCTACVHEFPVSDMEEAGPAELEVEVELDRDSLFLYREIGYTRAETTPLYQRFQVELYNLSTGTPALARQQTLYRAVGDSSSLELRFSGLRTEPYQCVVFQDYVDDPISESLYYTFSSLEAVSLPAASQYLGNTDDKDCTAATLTFDLTPYRGQQSVVVHKMCSLSRPLAKVVFLTTDVKAYLAQYTSTESDLAAMRVEVRYTTSLPTCYNAFTGALTQYSAGYRCTAHPVLLDTGEARLAFDYLFCDATTTTLDASLYLYNADGFLLTYTEVFAIPITKGGITYVRDAFLTLPSPEQGGNTGGGSGGGVVIDNEFSGEFNIDILF